MKTFRIAILPLLALILAPLAHAQNQYILANGGTANIAAASTNTYTLYPRLVNTRLATVALQFSALDTDTDPVTLEIDGSVNGSSWVLGALGSYALAADGTDAVTGSTNIDTAGYLLMRVRAINASATVAVTNVLISVGLKRGVEPTLPVQVAYGGTGSSTAAAARTALGVVAATAGTATGLTLAGTTTNSGLTASLPVFTGAQKQLASVSIANTKIALGIQAGSCVTAADGTVTNTFATAFSSAPFVILTQRGLIVSPTNALTSVTTTNFVLSADTPSVTNHWIAIGAP